MKVWVLSEHDWENSEVLGVHSSLEFAQLAAPTTNEWEQTESGVWWAGGAWSIQEFEIQSGYVPQGVLESGRTNEK